MKKQHCANCEQVYRAVSVNKIQSQQVVKTVHGRTEHYLHTYLKENTFGNQ